MIRLNDAVRSERTINGVTATLHLAGGSASLAPENFAECRIGARCQGVGRPERQPGDPEEGTPTVHPNGRPGQMGANRV
jgi:hypothetical protein